jgi:hypothetical protein
MQEGDVIEGRYKIEKKLGQGGMGLVFRGHDNRNNKAVAIKVLFPNTPDIVIKRFHAEAKALAALNHPNIMTVQHFGQDETGQLYLVMDLIKGDSLSVMIENRGAQTFFDMLPIFEKICRGLRYAHMNNVLHRDLKPSNVMLASDRTKEDSVKLVDFGLAKHADKEQELTKTGAAMGSPPYMSPEAVYGKESDERSDIYSLGCTFFEMMAGRPPFIGDTPFHVMMAHVNRLAPTLSEASGKQYEEEVEEFIQKCMKKSPADRFQNMDELIKGLERVKTTLIEKKRSSEGILASGIYASGAFIADRKRKADEWLKNNARLAGILGALFFVVTAVVIVMQYQNYQGSGRTVQEGFTEVAEELKKPELESEILDFTDGRSNYDTGASIIKDKGSPYDACLLSGEMDLEQVKQAVADYKDMNVFQFEKLDVDNETVKYILSLGFEKLVLFNTKLTKELFDEIGQTKSIKILKVVECGPIPQGYLDGLAESKTLESIELECGLEYKNLGRVLGRIKKLHSIQLLQASLTREDVKEIVHGLLVALFYLKKGTLSDDALVELKDAKICRLLGFIDTRVTAENLAGIASCPHLYTLSLHKTGITDSELPNLYGAHEMRTVDLTANDVSPGAVAKLKAALPRLQGVATGAVQHKDAF